MQLEGACQIAPASLNRVPSKGIAFSEETLDWVRRALRASHADEKQFHGDAIAKLQREHRRLQDRIDAMYMDKFNSRIGNDSFDAKVAEIRKEQGAIMREIEAHQTANRSYIEEGVQLLELAQRAHVLFERQPAGEKRRLSVSYSRTAHGKAAN